MSALGRKLPLVATAEMVTLLVDGWETPWEGWCAIATCGPRWPCFTAGQAINDAFLAAQDACLRKVGSEMFVPFSTED